MRVLELRRLSTLELAHRANRELQLRIISKLPKERLKASKVFDPIFEEPIPKHLKN